MSRRFVKFIIVAACLLGGNAIAQEPGKLTPLPDKLPPSVEARVGKVEFNKGLPTQKGLEQLFEIQDFQRATQLYQWAIPAIGVMGWHRASIANGKTSETDWVLYLRAALLDLGMIRMELVRWSDLGFPKEEGLYHLGNGTNGPAGLDA